MSAPDSLRYRQMTAELADFFIAARPDYTIHLLFNAAAWVNYDRGGGKPLSMDSAANWIQRVAKVVDHKALGTSATRHPENRMGLVVFPEQPERFLHYHGFVWLPEVKDAHRGRAFAWHWFEDAWTEAWEHHVPGGTVQLSRLESYLDGQPTERAVRYALKEGYKGHTFSDFVISPASGALPLSMRRRR